MATKNPKKLSQLEAVIMDCVWIMAEEDGGAAATVRKVQERLEPVKPMAYNTVLTMMRILRDKGFLSSKREGRMDVYEPRISREKMAGRSLGEVLDRFFSGSREALVSNLLDSGDLSADEIRSIRREIDRRLRGKANGKGAKR